HDDVYHKASVLHHDVSAGNVVIHLGVGILIDWDLAKLVDTSGPRQTTRTGTWQFMSVALMYNRGAAHTFGDNLESALYVLL
ncbi:hypothetical protein HYDPIDRAFT_84142, partial [Hydnomerulius pinastri MD-312]